MLMLMSQPGSGSGKVKRNAFGSMPDGSNVEVFTVTDGWVEARVSSYGARLVSVRMPDRDGVVGDVVLGHDALEPYLADANTYMGAIVGRFGNRIAGGAFVLDGVRHQVPVNNPPNALHGGTHGFDGKVWRAEVEGDVVVFRLTSPDGEMGFPGTLEATVKYSLEDGALRMEYEATTDEPTVVNLTNHAYFNLAGEGCGTVLGHEVMLPAESFVATDATAIPLGPLAPVAGTPFDFRSVHTIGERIGVEDVQLEWGRGYDHTFVLGEKGVMKLAAEVTDPASGRRLTVETTEPGVQFYTGNYLDGTVPKREGSGGYERRTGFCLETQGFPDAPNQPGFPSTVLRPGETLRSVTVYRFSTEV